MYYVLIISLALFYVGYSLYVIKKNKKSRGVKRSLIMVGEELFLPLPFFFVVSILFDILPSVAYPFAAVVSLAVIFVVGYIRGRYHDADIYLFTFFGFCVLGMLENTFGLSLGAAIVVGLCVFIPISLLYIYMLYLKD